jgi:cellulose synthase/poly-beta-1,6-N-acetylglucosamine synthase-like glycosyltransferase
MMEWIGWVYAATILVIAAFGAHLALMLALAIWHRAPRPASPPPVDWPTVVVQLPLFNERYVVERLIDAAAGLDYPAERLTVQVLDDSTDDTAARAKARVAYHRARGRNVVYCHRHQREGFKAGALALGLAQASGEFVAVFDADFTPPPDFLRRLIPDFLADPQLGLVQARWEHLNARQNFVTRTQALAYDGYFAVDQVARARAGLWMNFNGSAGVWRRACIEDAGGWQGDTLAEDLDLSYRAQLKGWRLDYRPEAAAPAELPPSLLALKRQQFRWAKGSFQVLRKLGPELLRSPQSPFRKALGLLHLAGYLPHPLMVVSLILSLPVVLVQGPMPLNWEALGWLGCVPPLVTLWGQARLRRRDWLQSLAHYPVMALGMIGLALNNTRAFAEACLGLESEFKRTPKFSAISDGDVDYALPLDWTTWGELILALYAFATGLIAIERAPSLTPVMFIYTLAFGCTAALGFWESGAVRRAETAREMGTD